MLLRGTPPTTWTSRHHFGPTHAHIGPLHAPFLCGVWHNGHDHFVVFYICPDYWTILDPLNDNYTPSHDMLTNIASALTTTYQHYNEQCPLIPRYLRVQRIAIQNDYPLEPWSCGTIAILTTLHLTLGNTRPDRIPANSITRQQMLNLHQALLQWLIIGTPPELWNIQCLNTDIVTIPPISVSEHHTHVSLLQADSLPRGSPFSPTHQQPQNNTADTTYTPSSTSAPKNTHHLPTFLQHTQHMTTPSQAQEDKAQNKPTTTTPPKQTFKKQSHILNNSQRIKRTALAKRREAYRTKLYTKHNLRPLSDFWPNIIPQSLPVHPPPPPPRNYNYHTSYTASDGSPHILPTQHPPESLQLQYNLLHPRPKYP